MDTLSIISLIDTIINGIGLVGIVILVIQFMKERKKDKNEEFKERKVQRGKPLLSIWDDAIDNINSKLENDYDIWLIDPEQIEVLLNGKFYYVHLSLPHNRFITKAKVEYCRNIDGKDSSSLERHEPQDLGTVSPDNGYIQPISKDGNLSFFIYTIEYLNEINELMQYIVIAIVNATADKITKIYDILCTRKDEKEIKTPEIFSDSSWNDFKKTLGDKIVESLHSSVLKDEAKWDYLSYTEKVIERTCSAKVLKNKLNKANLSLNKNKED